MTWLQMLAAAAVLSHANRTVFELTRRSVARRWSFSATSNRVVRKLFLSCPPSEAQKKIETIFWQSCTLIAEASSEKKRSTLNFNEIKVSMTVSVNSFVYVVIESMVS